MAKLDRLLTLVKALVASIEALTLDEMVALGAKRRASERLRDVIQLALEFEEGGSIARNASAYPVRFPRSSRGSQMGKI